MTSPRPTDYAPDEEFARRLDANDPLARFRSRFLVPRRGEGGEQLYFLGNSLWLLPAAAREHVEKEMDAWGRKAVAGHFEGKLPWVDYHRNLTAPLARLVGALPSEVVAMNSCTVNLHLMMVSFYRPTPERHRVLMEDCAFPSDTYAVQSQIRFHGFDPAEALRVARPRPGESVLRTEDLIELLEREGDTIALVLLGGVNYFTGQFFDLESIGAAARRRGCAVGWDLAHAVGNLPLRMHDCEADFAVWCSYKYLNAGPGAIGGCFVHERHAGDGSLPRFAGWWGNDPRTRFSMHLIRSFVPVLGADGWQLSNPSILAAAPLLASLAIFEEAGLEALRAKSVALTGYLEFLIDRIPGVAYEILTPRDPAARGCQLSLRVKRDAAALQRRLEGAGIVADLREPGVLRFAPVPLYNTFTEVWRLAQALDAAASD
ncbi:MAG TPA: kynureninase [Candidatus Polarisedimenticolia bacterium]|nr:kynureninase [Candidatus Polarisedimenticolia bacterium]